MAKTQAQLFEEILEKVKKIKEGEETGHDMTFIFEDGSESYQQFDFSYDFEEVDLTR